MHGSRGGPKKHFPDRARGRLARFVRRQRQRLDIPAARGCRKGHHRRDPSRDRDIGPPGSPRQALPHRGAGGQGYRANAGKVHADVQKFAHLADDTIASKAKALILASEF